MAHLNDYVLWRGDLSFREREFTVEDNLVLSELVYIDYKPFWNATSAGSYGTDDAAAVEVTDKVFSKAKTVTLRKAIAGLDMMGALKNTRAGSGPEDLEFARNCAESKRFGDILLTDFRDEFDSSDRQFAAVTYII